MRAPAPGCSSDRTVCAAALMRGPCPAPLPPSPQVLAFPPIQPLIWGGKGVGSQGDGTAQLLCKGPEQQAQVRGAAGCGARGRLGSAQTGLRCGAVQCSWGWGLV
jgi:hypothetical protein